LIFPLKMVIFHSYVKLPEGKQLDLGCLPRVSRFQTLGLGKMMADSSSETGHEKPWGKAT
jgi:hypothetical protein